MSDVLPWRDNPAFPSPREALGLSPGWTWEGTNEELDAAAAWADQNSRTETARQQARVGWKALRDPYYRQVAARHQSWTALERAGFFDDGWSCGQWQGSLRDDKDFMTPVGAEEPSQEGLPVVLVLPGAMAPAHDGHILALLAAARRAEQAGWRVVGKYLSPSHDRYVSGKAMAQGDDPGTAAWTAARRIEQCQQRARGNGILVDPWECAGVDTALNFTDVLARLGRVVSRAQGQMVHPVLVCGSDNAGFAQAFRDQGRCIVVAREGYSLPEVETGAQDRVLTVTTPVAAHASRQLRAGGARVMSATPAYQGWWVRDDGAHATARWQVATEDWKRFHATLLAALRQVASEGWRTVGVRLDEQQQRVTAWQRDLPTDSIIGVLDACLEPGERRVALRGSRMFILGDAQWQAHDHLWHGLPHHLPHQSISHLLDDDRVSGHTLQRAAALPWVRKNAQDHTVRAWYPDTEHLDPLDARDFLMGSRDGGLVVQARGGEGRAWRVPYLWPYVDLTRRASIPVDEVREFSDILWQANLDFFSGSQLHVRDMDGLTQKFLVASGYDRNEPMKTVIQCERVRWQIHVPD